MHSHLLYQGFLKEHDGYRELWFRSSDDAGFHWGWSCLISNPNVEVHEYYDLIRGGWTFSLIAASWSQRDPLTGYYQLWFGYSTDWGWTWTIDLINDDIQLPLSPVPYYPSLWGEDSRFYLTFYNYNVSGTPQIGYTVFDVSSGSWLSPYEVVLSDPYLSQFSEIITLNEAGQDTPHVVCAWRFVGIGVLVHLRKNDQNQWVGNWIYNSSYGPLYPSAFDKGPDESVLHLAFREDRDYPHYDDKSCYCRSTDHGQGWSDFSFFGPAGVPTSDEHLNYDATRGGVNFIYGCDGYLYYRFRSDESGVWSPETVIAVQTYATFDQLGSFSSYFGRHVVFQVSPSNENDYLGYVASRNALYSGTFTATDHNNGRHLTRRFGEELYLTYQTDFAPDGSGQHDRNWVYFAQSADGGEHWSSYTWLNYGRYPAVGNWSSPVFPIPVPLVYLNEDPSTTDTIYYRYYDPFFQTWSDPLPVYTSQNDLDPPAVTAVEDTVFVIFAENSETESWIKCARFRFDETNPNNINFDIVRQSTSPNLVPLYTPSIQYDGNRAVHAVWQDGDSIMYARRRWYPDNYWDQYDPVSGYPIVPSHHPFIEVWGNYAYVVWTEAGDIYRRIRDLSTGQWTALPDNISNTGEDSNYPTASYELAVWSERDPEQWDFDIRYFSYNFGSGWIYQSDYLESYYPHTAIRPDLGGFYLYTIWTEEILGRPFQILSDRRFFLPLAGEASWYSVEAGNPEPSPFLIQRQGIKEYGKHRIDFDFKELIYELSFLDPIYDYYLIAVSYHEGKSRKEVWFIDGELVGEFKFEPNRLETTIVQIPYESYAKDRKARIEFRNAEGPFAANAGLVLLCLDHKSRGGGGQSGGKEASLAPRLQIGPNPTRGRLSITFSLSTPSLVRINLFDLTGRRVAVLHDRKLSAGKQKLSLILPERLASGIYFLILETAGRSAAKKVVLRR